MGVAEHYCVKQNEPDPKRTNSACYLHMWNPDFCVCVCVYMCVCVETGGRGEGDGSTCEMEMELCRGSGGPSRKTRGQGRAAGRKAQIETKK